MKLPKDGFRIMAKILSKWNAMPFLIKMYGKQYIEDTLTIYSKMEELRIRVGKRKAKKIYDEIYKEAIQQTESNTEYILNRL